MGRTSGSPRRPVGYLCGEAERERGRRASGIIYVGFFARVRVYVFVAWLTDFRAVYKIHHFRVTEVTLELLQLETPYLRYFSKKPPYNRVTLNRMRGAR